MSMSISEIEPTSFVATSSLRTYEEVEDYKIDDADNILIKESIFEDIFFSLGE
jgi:hypothetical protein